MVVDARVFRNYIYIYIYMGMQYRSSSESGACLVAGQTPFQLVRNKVVGAGDLVFFFFLIIGNFTLRLLYFRMSLL